MMRDPETDALRPFALPQLLQTVPELRGFNIELNSESFSKPIDSSDMRPEHWVKLAQAVYQNRDRFDGFVILHGSDTMAYTASALSFMLDGLRKPVVLTGSQLPIGQVRTDGRENLAGAIEIASMKSYGNALIPEVSIFFGSLLIRGNRAVKKSTEELDAFASPNFAPLARAGVHWQVNKTAILPQPVSQLCLHSNLAPEIGVIHLFPGIHQKAVNAILNAGLKGIVLRSFGSGNAHTDKHFLTALSKAVQSGTVVVNVSQCLSGGVVQGKYETSLGLIDSGVLSGGDMTFEAAVTKLMHLLGRYDSISDVSKYFLMNLKGERTS